MVRLARISAWARHEPAQIGVSDKVISTDPSTRERHHDDEYLREDGKCDAANAMKTLETMCATTVQPERPGVRS